jgi:hypothetical protein
VFEVILLKRFGKFLEFLNFLLEFDNSTSKKLNFDLDSLASTFLVLWVNDPGRCPMTQAWVMTHFLFWVMTAVRVMTHFYFPVMTRTGHGRKSNPNRYFKTL